MAQTEQERNKTCKTLYNDEQNQWNLMGETSSVKTGLVKRLSRARE